MLKPKLQLLLLIATGFQRGRSYFWQKEVPRKFNSIQADARQHSGRPREATTQHRYQVQVFCHHTRKDLRARRKDLTKYSRFVKAKVTTDDLRE